MAASPAIPPAEGRVRAGSLAFPFVAALGYAGGVVAYVPLLTLLLPLRIEQMAADTRFGVLAATLIAGSVMASGSGILFGWLSDRSLERGGGRRSWMLLGLIGTAIAYAAIAWARTPFALVAAVVAFQFALNAVLAPLVALLAEESADREKGLMSGLLAVGQPFAAAIGPMLIAWTLPSLDIRLAVIGTVAALCLAPLMLSPPRRTAQTAADASPAAPRDLAVAWTSRLLMQIAGNVVFAYLLYFMEAFAAPADHAGVPVRVGTLLLVASLLPLPVAVAVGRWSDRLGRRKPFLLAAALLASGGLAAMAVAGGWRTAALGFCLYSIGWGVFLALQVGFVMQLLPNPDRRGRDLGLVNLSNTVPVLIGPALTWLLATPQHLGPLLLTLAILSFVGGAAMLGVRSRR